MASYRIHVWPTVLVIMKKQKKHTVDPTMPEVYVKDKVKWKLLTKKRNVLCYILQIYTNVNEI